MCANPDGGQGLNSRNFADVWDSQTMRTRTLTAMFALVLLPALSGAANAQTLTADQVVEKHLAAIGGREALSKITSRRAIGTISVSTPVGELGGSLEMTAKAPNKMRASFKIDISAVGGAGMMEVDQMFDGTNGWMMNSMQGDTPMSGDQLEGAKNAYFPSPLLNYKTTGATVALEPSQKVNDRDAIVLLMTPKTGPASRMFFDAQTFLLVRTVTRIKSPELGEVDQFSEPADYKAVDGMQVPFTIYQSAGGQSVTMKFTKIENNVAVDDAVFIKK